MIIRIGAALLMYGAITAGRAQAAPETAAKAYRDSRGKEVRFPLGDASFADVVEVFKKGKPSATPAFSQANESLGPPNYKKGGQGGVTLGCGGVLVARFTDNGLVDVEGPDLYIFEVGPRIEATDLAVSADGKTWIDVGRVEGGTAEVDISAKVEPLDVFHWVRLTDLRSECRGRYPGADLDAIGAIGAGLSLSVKSSVLFDSGAAALKASAKSELQQVVDRIKTYPKARVLVLGHTDNRGGDRQNLDLSRTRAESVQRFLADSGVTGVETKGYGETRPAAPNDDDAGREQNRRVEIVVVPPRN